MPLHAVRTARALAENRSTGTDNSSSIGGWA